MRTILFLIILSLSTLYSFGQKPKLEVKLVEFRDSVELTLMDYSFQNYFISLGELKPTPIQFKLVYSDSIERYEFLSPGLGSINRNDKFKLDRLKFKLHKFSESCYHFLIYCTHKDYGVICYSINGTFLDSRKNEKKDFKLIGANYIVILDTQSFYFFDEENGGYKVESEYSLGEFFPPYLVEIEEN
jgi:hypothetical protein